MHKRTRACAISQKVKRIVYARDGGACIFCGRPGLPEAHIVSRAQGGKGIETNIVTACRECHEKLDNSPLRASMMQYAEEYMRKHYDGWKRQNQAYRKGEE